MSEKPQRFVDRCLSGDAYLDEIEDYVELWHSTETDEDVWTFLGLTRDEYALWVERPSSLRYVLFARRFGAPLEKALDLNSPESLAARAPSKREAESILEWLRHTGRLRMA
jgi:hypothetical protein